MHIGSSRLDSSISFPEYAPSPPRRARTAGGGARLLEEARMAHDTGRKQGTRAQTWGLVGNNPAESELLQPNWPSSAHGTARPRHSPISFKKKNHLTASKRELDLFGNRPVSPARDRPDPSVSEFEPKMRLTRDGSFGNTANERVYKSWVDPGRGKERRTGQPDDGPISTAGPRGRVSGVGLNSGRIDVIGGY